MPDQIRDLLYFDYAKAVSIWSQFEEGLPERVLTEQEVADDVGSGTRVGIPKLAEAHLRESGSERRLVAETRLLHHDVLNKLEAALTERELLVDLGQDMDSESVTAEQIRRAIGSAPYVRAEGWAVIEDYRRIQFISERFNRIMKFLGQCSVHAAKSSPAYREAEQQIEAKEDEISRLGDRNAKARAREKIKAMRRKLDDMVQPELQDVDDWLLEGIRFWIETFMPSRINFRVYPFERCSEFQVLCNLKEECFVDENLEHLLYGYGVRPNVRLGVMGLVTSIPPEDDSLFDPLSEFEGATGDDDKVAFEAAFRRVFQSMDDIEAFMRYSRYPNVSVHPIAVFRQF